MFYGINLWAVLVAAVSTFLLGGIWYSRPLFGNTWCKANGMNIDESCKKGHGTKPFIVGFLLSLIAAAMFAIFLGPQPAFRFATVAGFATGLCFVATSFGINYLFANRSLKLFFIDAGYHTLQFTLYGIILGLWH